jgi:hypothetical protein
MRHCTAIILEASEQQRFFVGFQEITVFGERNDDEEGNEADCYGSNTFNDEKPVSL